MWIRIALFSTVVAANIAFFVVIVTVVILGARSGQNKWLLLIVLLGGIAVGLFTLLTLFGPALLSEVRAALQLRAGAGGKERGRRGRPP